MSVHFSSSSRFSDTDRAEEPAPTEPDSHAIRRETLARTPPLANKKVLF